MKKIKLYLSAALISSLFSACATTVEVASVSSGMGDEKQAKLMLKLPSSGYFVDAVYGKNGKVLTTLRKPYLSGSYYLDVWNLENGKRAFTIQENLPSISVIDNSGELIASVSEKSTIKVTSIKTGSLVRTLRSPLEKQKGGCLFGSSDVAPGITSLAFSPDGKIIAAANTSGKVLIWDIEKESPLKSIPWHIKEAFISKIAFGNDSSTIIIGGGDTYYRTESRTGYRSECASYSKGVCTSYRSVPYTYYVQVAWYKPLVKIININTNAIVGSEQNNYEGIVSAIAVSAGNKVAIGISSSNSVEIMDMKCARSADIKAGPWIKSLSFSKNGSNLIAGNMNGSVIVAETASGKILDNKKRHLGAVISVAFGSSPERYITIGDSTVRTWDFKENRQTALFTQLKEKAWVASLSDGKYDGTEDGIENLTWIIGDQSIPLKNFGSSFRTEGVIALMFRDNASQKSVLSIASQLIGTVKQINGNEIIVSSGRSNQTINIGDIMFLVSDNKKIPLKVTFPMMSVAKCQAVNIVDFNKIRTGMPVFSDR